MNYIVHSTIPTTNTHLSIIFYCSFCHYVIKKKQQQQQPNTMWKCWSLGNFLLLEALTSFSDQAKTRWFLNQKVINLKTHNFNFLFSDLSLLKILPFIIYNIICFFFIIWLETEGFLIWTVMPGFNQWFFQLRVKFLLMGFFIWC